ncbi:MAG: GrpB family protein, partial [Atopobiaceae bacterium]|nr:GrpB family protein [Atopobiaceae bacterium]
QRISHIGSTAIDGIMAKDIVDILIELPERANMEAAASALEQAGFIVMSSEGGRISLNRGYTPDGFADEVFHVHLRYAGDNDELYFRDFLNDHPEVAREYEALKLALWKRFEHNRNAYTEAKTDFITTITARAKVDYAGRY